MSEAKQIEIGDFTYEIGKLNCVDQFHVLRRLAPFITDIAVLAKLRDTALDGMGVDELAKALAPLSRTLAQVDDEAANYVLQRCLSEAKRITPTGSARRMWDKGAPMMTYPDLDVVSMLRLVYEVVMASLGSFFAASPSNSSAATAA